ncbi:MAG: zinc ribbon domain-containing protein [Candidatus Binataceae bacterium]
MRCPQCGNDCPQGVQFCSRCGTRMFAPKPAAVREYMLAKIHPSMWRYANTMVVGSLLIIGGAYLLARMLQTNPQMWPAGFGVMGLGVIAIVNAMIQRRRQSWTVTSDRIFEQRGILATSRREMELADIRSVEVSKRVIQRMLGLGDIIIASAASADFAIRLLDVRDPDGIADTIRKARLKRLA